MHSTNKQVFEWPMTQGPNVNWIKRARWVQDGKFVSSSGVSAGKKQGDRETGFIEQKWIRDVLNQICFSLVVNFRY